jgi:hypothetical protein
MEKRICKEGHLFESQLLFISRLNNRRNTLISYDKHLEAGAYGVSPDEQRTLKLVRELYAPLIGTSMLKRSMPPPKAIIK